MKLIKELKNQDSIDSPSELYKFLKEFQNEDREYLIVIGIDSKNVPIFREIVSIGTLNSGICHPREIFKKAIICSANKILMAHNHPSGNITPSKDDIKTMEKIKSAGEILGIDLLDSIIITNNNYYSYISEK